MRFRVNFIFILTIHISMGGAPDDVSEEPVTQEKRKKGWRMSCDVGEATNLSVTSPTPLRHLRHSSFSNPSFASCVTGSSLVSPGEAPMHISYANYKIFTKYCGRQRQKQGSD